MRKEYRVTTKAAIFNQDRSKVLVIHMTQRDGWGLPGGHVEENESIDETIRRELIEETGITPGKLTQAGFFFHSNGKLVLAYTGIASRSKLISSQNDLEGIPKWLSRTEFDSISIEPNYRRLVVDNWN